MKSGGLANVGRRVERARVKSGKEQRCWEKVEGIVKS